jgi:glycosyltransferase involved in cell wall biosynthesis
MVSHSGIVVKGSEGANKMSSSVCRGRSHRWAASVVIPAHNEASVIAVTLDVLLDDAELGEFEVIVVANGCTDRTAAIARSKVGVRVVETTGAGKAAALRSGDAECDAFPRLYLDADVRISANSIREMIRTLQATDIEACAPTLSWDVDECTALVRRAYHAHNVLFSPHRGLAGVGAYMLSEAGHRRVFPIPDLIADDEWVHRHFAPHQRCTVKEAQSVTRAAPNVRAMVRRRARARAGNRELDALGVHSASPAFRLRDLMRLVRSRHLLALDAMCFAGVALADRVLTGWRACFGEDEQWSTDRHAA